MPLGMHYPALAVRNIRQTDITGRPRDTATELAHERSDKLDCEIHRTDWATDFHWKYHVIISCMYSEMHSDFIWVGAFRMARDKTSKDKPKHCFQELTLNELLKSVEEVCKSEVIFILV